MAARSETNTRSPKVTTNEGTSLATTMQYTSKLPRLVQLTITNSNTIQGAGTSKQLEQPLCQHLDVQANSRKALVKAAPRLHGPCPPNLAPSASGRSQLARTRLREHPRGRQSSACPHCSPASLPRRRSARGKDIKYIKWRRRNDALTKRTNLRSWRTWSA